MTTSTTVEPTNEEISCPTSSNYQNDTWSTSASSVSLKPTVVAITTPAKNTTFTTTASTTAATTIDAKTPATTIDAKTAATYIASTTAITSTTVAASTTTNPAAVITSTTVNDGDSTDSFLTGFWYIPMATSVLLLFIVTMLIILLYKAMRKRKAR